MPAHHRPAATGALVAELFGCEQPVAVAQVLALGVTPGALRAAVRAGTLIRLRHGVVAAPGTVERTDLDRAPGPPHETPQPSTDPGSPAVSPPTVRLGGPPAASLPRSGITGGPSAVSPPIVRPRRPSGAAYDADPSATALTRRTHLVAARAALVALADDSVVSHGSAALLHALPTFGPTPSSVWVTAPRHGRVVVGTHRRLGVVRGADRTEIEGLPVTTAARTALDLARRRPLHQQLVALDAAAARVGLDALARAFARLSWQRDLIGLAQALRCTDPAAETPLESISRGRILQAELPAPELQGWVQGDDGRWYRVDFLWREQRVVGEADGALKYRGRDDLVAEKGREDALRALGWRVVRWTYDEAVRRPDRFLTRLTQLLSTPTSR